MSKKNELCGFAHHLTCQLETAQLVKVPSLLQHELGIEEPRAPSIGSRIRNGVLAVRIVEGHLSVVPGHYTRESEYIDTRGAQ